MAVHGTPRYRVALQRQRSLSTEGYEDAALIPFGWLALNGAPAIRLAHKKQRLRVLVLLALAVAGWLS